MAGVAFICHGVHLALHHELVVVQVTVVGSDTEILPHVLTAETFLTGHESFIQLLAVAGADDVRARVAEELLHSLGQIPNG